MSKTAEPIILSPEEYTTLIRWTRQRSLPLRTVQRARIIQMAADGLQNQDTSLKVGVSVLRFNYGDNDSCLYVCPD